MVWRNLVLLILFCAGVGKAWHGARQGFRLDRCQLTPFEWVGTEPTELEAQALSLPFRFLAAGRQCYAFESADGQYVLKIPRTDVFRARLWRGAGDRLMRKVHFSRSVELARSVLQEETHLSIVRSPGSVTLIDALGRKSRFSCVTWLLQKKVLLLSEQLRAARAKGDAAQSEQLVHAFDELLERITEKGMVCKDLSFKHNIGYDGRGASFVDIGAFCPREEWPFSMRKDPL